MKKKILITVYNMEIGGIERSLINMLKSFDYTRYEVDLLIFEHKGEFMRLIPSQVNVLPQLDAYSFFRNSLKLCLLNKQFIIFFIRICSKIQALIKSIRLKLEEGPGYIQMQLTMKYAALFLPKIKGNYDVAISYAWPHDLVAEKVNADLKIAWIHTDYSKLEIDHPLDLKVWKKFSRIISISEDVTNSFLSSYPSLHSRIHLIENISSADIVNQIAEESIVDNDFNKQNFTILSVGRLSYVKGYDLAVKALRVLHDKGYTNIQWNIVGYGGYKEELQDLIKENQLESSFKLLGKKENPYPYIKACDLYVQPSRYEGKAVTVTEAMILKRPIIITNYPTAKSQIQDKVNGLICEIDAVKIAQTIEILYKDETLRRSFSFNIDVASLNNMGELEKLYELIDSNKENQTYSKRKTI
ncbi:glycosyltransferase [Halobacillus sp. BBL2006]|uniref:glycosyltransferase n=1 Tax=Halobacillus sp. BBL2006 TaxID=1543706 RepID=UPI00068C4FD4|nr:glycosyltransferase [Halobacillus sp. BBL2006]